MANFETFLKAIEEHEAPKGRIFEDSVCHWILKNHPIYKSRFKTIWSYKNFPKKWFATDIGTDLIAEDQDGRYWAIQAKHYDKKYSITKKDLDTFYSDSDKEIIYGRMLIATTDKSSKQALVTLENSSKPFDFLSYTRLKTEIKRYPDSLKDLKKNKTFKAESIKRRPHQNEAINNVLSNLKDRGQLIMACGTGKTYTGQWIDEDLNSQSTLVLFPSLLLLSKTLRDWKPNDKEERMYLPVCSDDSVRKAKSEDSIAMKTSELGYPATTDPAEIAKFLKRKGKKAIFSTYQSAGRITEAFASHKIKPFDLIICDEAHRLAGKPEKKGKGNEVSGYKDVLDDKKIPSKKRLFMTATPRVFSTQTKASAKARDIEIISMDDESIFGPVLHKLSFGDAINRKDDKGKSLLTDYQVVVMGVEENEIAQSLIENRSFVDIEGKLETDAQSLASQIALLKAINKYNLKRVITFHNRRNDASEFSRETSNIRSILRGKAYPKGVITSDYLDGQIPASEREEKLEALAKLANEDIYIVSNAKCLSEGVDVPALDGVAFMAPKRSEIDIVQAVGRAIRQSDSKTKGTILVPLLINSDMDIDEQFNDSVYDQVWKVISALRSHDETLGDDLDELRVQLGKRKKPSFKGTKIIIDLPLKVNKKIFEQITLKIIERTTVSWMEWYGLMQKYIDDKGTAAVHKDEKYEDQALGVWVDTQRVNYRRGVLSEEKIKLLEKFIPFGWIWNPVADAQDKLHRDLEDFYNLHGHCLVPGDYKTKDGEDLLTRVRAIRNSIQKGTIDQKRLKMLQERFNFVSNHDDYMWELHAKALKKWMIDNKKSPDKGTIVNIYPEAKIPINRNLELFRSKCLGSYKYWNLGMKGKRKVAPQKLTDQQIKFLESIPNWSWDLNHDRWMKFFNELEKYNNQKGNPHVPAAKYLVNIDGEMRDLSRWCAKQRGRYEDGTLEAYRTEKLNKLGFDWTGRLTPKKKEYYIGEEIFDERVALCKEFIKENGYRILQSTRYKDVPLGKQVSKWCIAYTKGELTREQIVKIESITDEWIWGRVDLQSTNGIVPPIISEDLIPKLLMEREHHEINLVVKLGLIAGLRLYDIKNFKIVNKYGIKCFHIKNRKGYAERFIPIHKSLNLKKIPQTSGALSIQYTRSKVIQSIAPAGNNFFSLHLNFRKKLKDLGIDNDFLNAVSGWNPRIDWNRKNLQKLNKFIQAIEY